tara:strand:- start:334 stop:618 length:285 start_codon:yes stop_codon:yes gene_type:complete
MIDTDKYIGHTPAPWKWIIDDKDTYLSCFGNDVDGAKEHQMLEHDMWSSIEADENLIADAPKLLAFYLRVKEIMDMEEIEEIVRVGLILQEMNE